VSRVQKKKKEKEEEIEEDRLNSINLGVGPNSAFSSEPPRKPMSNKETGEAHEEKMLRTAGGFREGEGQNGGKIRTSPFPNNP